MMNSLFFGIVIGLFLYFAGERFIKVALKAFRERKVNSRKELVEIVNEIVNKGE